MHILLIPGLYLKAIPTPNLQEALYKGFNCSNIERLCIHHLEWIVKCNGYTLQSNRQQLDSDYMYPQPLRT